VSGRPGPRVPPPLGARRPRLTLAVAALALALLGLLGTGLDGKLHTTLLSVPGTESSRGAEMLAEHFGDSAPFAILLRGPAGALERQGPRLIAALHAEDRRLTSVSPWSGGSDLRELRPNRHTALALVDFHVPTDTAVTGSTAKLERALHEVVRAPVRARAAGVATVARAVREESLNATKRGEIILAPLLLVVLLLVFRSPVAAAIPLLFGATTIVATRGVLAILAGFLDVSAFAVSIATMIGLAIGIDYALLIVSRFREELDDSADPLRAASITRRTAGRTTVFAGSILLLAVVLAVSLVPGELLFSICAAVTPAILIAVAGPWLIAPAILVLIGSDIDRWRIGHRGPRRTRWLDVSRAALRRPGLAAAAIVALLLAIALPATSLSTEPLTIEQLSPHDQARVDVEAIEAVVGGGWVSPSVAIAVDERGPITQPRDLAALAAWQRRLQRLPGVEAVIGPGPLAGRAAGLRHAGRGFLGGEGDRAGGPAAQLARARAGVERLHQGLARASEGALALADGSGRARDGAGLLSHGLDLAASGGERAKRALARFSHGSHALAEGERGLGFGVSLLPLAAEQLDYEVAGLESPWARRLSRSLSAAAAEAAAAEAAAGATVEELEAARHELEAMGIGAEDPHYPALRAALLEAADSAAGVEGEVGDLTAVLKRGSREASELSTALARTVKSIRELRRLAGKLREGVAALEDGSGRLAGGSDRIVSGAARVKAGLSRLAHGSQRLAAGLAEIQGGNSRLSRGLSAGYRRSRPLVAGARRAQRRVAAAREQLRQGSPGLLDSGYFVLSVLDGAPPHVRELAAQAIDLDHGGQAAKLLVVGSGSEKSVAEMTALNDRVRASADALAARTGLRIAVTGGISQSVDYERATSSRLPWLVLAITLSTFLIMLAILQALPLAALAITLNLMAVAAAFGVLRLLSLLPSELAFGGANNIDPVGAAGIFGVVFGLSIDYSVFLLVRTREGRERHGSNEAAISFGLERTASVITGAATIMVCVFLVFATAPLKSVAQFGVSLTVAVLLDATVIRLMLMPALMKLIGPRVWWMPGWLGRALPRIDVH
jgi:putative drug exporter of the RND superfamily